MTDTDWIGSLGVFLILLAYILNIFGKLKPGQLAFILLNLIGASLACVASIIMNYWPFIVLEAVWSLASLVSLFRYKKLNI